MSKIILIMNAGSSSIKFKLFDYQTLGVIASGICEQIFWKGQFTINFNNKKETKAIPLPNHEVALSCILDELKKHNVVKDTQDIVGVGHRVVLGKTTNGPSEIIDDKVIAQINALIKLAPLHNGPELDVIKLMTKILPHATQVASYDNGFHLTIPEYNYIYPINYEVSQKYSIRLYGFHGNSYRYITETMSKLLNKDKPNLIIAHLGSGASIAAIKEGKSYNTSMGLTPLDGLMMGTRCGRIDPSIIIYLYREGMSIQQIDDMLNKQSGLTGVCKTTWTQDIAKRCSEGDKQTQLAVDIYSKRVASYIVDYHNQLNGKVDAIVFTAGVGENSPFFVESIVKQVNTLGLDINVEKNNANYIDYKVISTNQSKIPLYCVRTDEEIMIAKDVKLLVS